MQTSTASRVQPLLPSPAAAAAAAAAAAVQLVRRRSVQARAASSLAAPQQPAGLGDDGAQQQQALQPQQKPLFSSRAKLADACLPWLKVAKNRCVRVLCCAAAAGRPAAAAAPAGGGGGGGGEGLTGRSAAAALSPVSVQQRMCCASPTRWPPSPAPPPRSNLERSFALEELYEGDISSVHIATCRANQEKVVIKVFNRRCLEARVDLQNKVCLWVCCVCVC
jgi:hypothetical protein